MGGSNPPLLWSAILCIFCVVLSIPVDQLELVFTATLNLIGGFTMDTKSITAVTFAVPQLFTSAFCAITAGLAANGISPHL